MSLLESIVTQVVQNAVQGNQQAAPKSQAGGLGDLLGAVLGSQSQSTANSGLGGVLGSVLASQMGGSQANSGLGGLLGGFLGGQPQKASPTDLGSVLGTLLNSGAIGGRSGGLNKNTLLLALLPIVLGYIQKNGGLSGVLNKFNHSGLGNKAQSWVSLDADNDGLDAGDIQRLFDPSDIERACSQTGASESEVCQGIAELLPQVVNDLTPAGGLQHESQANQEIADILRQLGQ